MKNTNNTENIQKNIDFQKMPFVKMLKIELNLTETN